MKRTKRFIAFLLSVIMVFALSACGKKDGTEKNENVFSEIAEMAQIKQGTSEVEMSLKVVDKEETLKSMFNTDTIKVKISGYAKNENESVSKMQADLGSGYQDVTDYVFKDNKIYLNSTNIFKFVLPLLQKYAKTKDENGEETNALGSLTAEQVKMIVGGDYIEFTEDDMKNLASTTDTASYKQALSNPKSALNIMQAFGDVANDKCISTFKDVEGTLGKTDDNLYTFTVNKDNAKALVEKLADFLDKNGADLVKALLDNLKDISGADDEGYKKVESSKSDLESGIADLAKSLKNMKVEEFVKAEPNFVLTAGIDGKKGKRSGKITFKGSAKDQSTSINISLTGKIDEAGTGEVKVPENTVAYADFSSKLGLDAAESSQTTETEDTSAEAVSE